MIIRKWNGTDTWVAQSVETDLRSLKTTNAKLGSTVESDYPFTAAGKLKEAHLPDFVFGGMRFQEVLSSPSSSTIGTKLLGLITTYGSEDAAIGSYFIAGDDHNWSSTGSANNGITYISWSAQNPNEEDATTSLNAEKGDWIVVSSVSGAGDSSGDPYAFKLSVINNTYALATGSADGIMSSSDFTKLAGIATGANLYVHPSHPGDDINLDTGALTGATVISDLDFNITSDTSGHITDANASYATRTLTLANLGYTGATDANNYVHPTHPGDDFSIDTGALTGAYVISDLDINVTSDSSGHITDANATVATRQLTLSDLGYTAPGNGTHTISGTTDQVTIATSGGAFTANKSSTTTTTLSLSYPVYYEDTEGALPTSNVPNDAIGFEY